MRCPFAIWTPLNGGVGAFTSGPYKIVHHTTEGDSMEGALTALGSAHSDSHFVIDDRHIRQLIDTGEASRSLRNSAGGVQTNKDSAIQIEIVGRAGKLKNRDTLALVRKLCRWIEANHSVAPIWPNGYPKTFKTVKGKAIGQDPGGHNRDAKTWDTVSGHYGHSQVPENTHWDPGYTQEEVDFLMADTPVPSAAVITVQPKAEKVLVFGVKPDTLNLRALPNGAVSGVLPEGTELAVVSRQGRWVKVSTPGGAVGWVYDKFIKAEE